MEYLHTSVCPVSSLPSCSNWNFFGIYINVTYTKGAIKHLPCRLSPLSFAGQLLNNSVHVDIGPRVEKSHCHMNVRLPVFSCIVKLQNM